LEPNLTFLHKTLGSGRQSLSFGWAFVFEQNPNERHNKKEMKYIIKLIVLSVPVVIYSVIDAIRTDV